LLSFFNTYLNGFEPLQIKIFMYCLGTSSACIMKPVVSFVEEKRQENQEKPDHQITAWRFYKPVKEFHSKIFTFTSYIIRCEIEVARIEDGNSRKKEALENLEYAKQMMFDMKYNKLANKETENGTPTGIIMRKYVADLVKKGFILEGNQTMWGRFSCTKIKSIMKNGALILQQNVRADLEEAMKQRILEYKNLHLCVF